MNLCRSLVKFFPAKLMILATLGVWPSLGLGAQAEAVDLTATSGVEESSVTSAVVGSSKSREAEVHPQDVVGPWAFGFRYFGLAGTGMQGNTDNTPILGLRRRLSPKTNLELLAGFGSQVVESRYNQFSTTNAVYADRYLSAHLGYDGQHGLLEPLEGLSIQVLDSVIATYSQSDVVVAPDGSSAHRAGWAVDAFAGFGFEYFLPLVKRISLEGGAGLDLNFRVIPAVDSSGTLYTLTLNSVSQMPVNLLGVPLFGAVHWYF
jgi:hypothetical protein